MALFKLVVTFIIITACSAIESEIPKAYYSEGDRSFYFPGDGDGMIHAVDRHAPVNKTFINILEETNNNSYALYSRKNTNTPQMLVFEDKKSVKNSNFDASKVTVFLAHGWKGHGRNYMNLLLIEAFLRDNDVNVIVLDYSYASDLFYTTSVQLIPAVGTYLGKFIKWLTELGASYDYIHLVGFSLGAHVIGIAGRHSQGKVKRITALDPAGPLWYDNDKCLSKTDAQYVEVIHTNTLLFGYSGLLGDADFFPNGGTFMPGCPSNACSHSISYEYMALTVQYNNISSYKCEGMNDVKSNACHGEPYYMGNSNLHKYGTGIYRGDINETKFNSLTSVLIFEDYLDSNVRY